MWSPEFFLFWQGIACTKHGGSVHSLGIWQLLSRPAYASGCIYLCCDCHCRWHICEGPCIESCGGQNVGSYNISEVLGVIGTCLEPTESSKVYVSRDWSSEGAEDGA